MNWAWHLCLSEQAVTGHAPYGVIQELDGVLLVHFVIRAVIFAAAQQQGLDPDRQKFYRDD